jgi:hypothetical protein
MYSFAFLGHPGLFVVCPRCREERRRPSSFLPTFSLLFPLGRSGLSLVLDHLELLYPKHPVNLPRILIGMPLLRRY